MLEQNSNRSAESLRRWVTTSSRACRRMKNVISPRSTTTFSITDVSCASVSVERRSCTSSNQPPNGCFEAPGMMTGRVRPP